MELLLIKSGEDYIRYKDNQYLKVGLDKASVFPMDQLDKVKRYASDMENHQFKNIVIKKLVLTEEDL